MLKKHFRKESAVMNNKENNQDGICRLLQLNTAVETYYALPSGVGVNTYVRNKNAAEIAW